MEKILSTARRALENEELQKTLKLNGTLIYASLYGSHLYGCHRESSDIDIKGIFLPFPGNVLNYEQCKSITRKIEVDGIPIDIELWSLQWFNKLLYKGDSNTIDLLFSHSNKSTILYDDNILFYDPCFSLKNIKEKMLFNKMTGIIGYCYRQAEKYGLKGTRLNEMVEFKSIINDILKSNEFDFDSDRFGDTFEILEPQLKQFNHIKKVLLNKKTTTEYGISLLGRIAPHYLPFNILLIQIDNIINGFGSRSKNAAEVDGKDFKALSHAYRAGYEYLSILEHGKIEFPLKDADYILKIKEGKIDYETTRMEIEKMIEKIGNIDGNVFKRNKPSINFLKDVVLKYYKFYYDYD